GGDAASCTLTITKTGGSVEPAGAFSPSMTQSGPGPWTFSWSESQGNGAYVATATVTTGAGCTTYDTSSWTIVGIPTCCLQVDPSLSTYPGSNNKSNKVNYFLRNDGTCSQDVVVDQQTLRLMLNEETCNGLPSVQKVTNVTTGDIVYCAGGG